MAGVTQTTPGITLHTLPLDLSRFDAAFSSPLFAQLTVLGPGVAMLAVGGQPPPFAWARDTSVALPRPNGPPAATTLSKGSSASLTLSSRLAKRYSTQFFLSLDLSSLASDSTAGPASAERAILPLERALVEALDTVLERKKR
ncbi:hypothetical protein RTG_00012 [Rhodotorula toruloides ATCC 204091]|uniref:Proteasome assembly chaperone 3 n=1 Tax=Rhodotorula toruloides TaxID=5286 RepID=A0A0K3CCQ4_RHOTO|nr:hypothetical protein RTG_00012 [Rhodotorula toruloides ATCC 204091]KAK4335021.1 hypothetical protein RTBOTA2_003795 [Rhodotorula toruloides]PRQ76479.1 hypothetical protein AAT19DRAFT_13501 [Rhodotorula toruloides]